MPGTGDELAQSRGAASSTELLGLVPVAGRSPLQAFARLHTLAGGDAGRRRGSADGCRRRLQSPVADAAGAPRRPALLVAAVVHAELAAAAPFGSHNGLVARAAERLVLVARGVDPASLVVPEAGHLALRADYESNLRGYRDGGAAGVHAWLLYAAEA